MLLGSSGQLERQKSSSSFIRHYGSGGVPVLPDEEVETQVGAEVVSGVSARVPAARIPEPEVLTAIQETSMRYAGHAGLRSAGLSVREWMNFFRANIEIESGYNPNAESHVGAVGLGQLMPGTARVLRVNEHDMRENLDGSARYLLMLLEKFSSRELALAGYNAGPQAVSKYGGIPPYKETQGHVVKVMAVFNRLNNGES